MEEEHFNLHSIKDNYKSQNLSENEKFFCFHNDKIHVLFDRKNGSLVGIIKDGIKIIDNVISNNSYWQIELIAIENQKPFIIKTQDVSSIQYEVKKNLGNTTLEITYIVKEKGQIKTNIMLDDSNNSIFWNLKLEVEKDYKIWSILFPQISFLIFGEPSDNLIVVPYRRGALYNFPYSQTLPYPSAMANMQFLAVYNQKTKEGLYYGVEDEEGFSKNFIVKSDARFKMVSLGISHLPPNRGLEENKYDIPYKVTISPFIGDWWTASQIYRNWWKKTKYASKGPMIFRKDTPEFLKKASIFARISTSKPERTVQNNVKNAISLKEFSNNIPIVATWYHFHKADEHTFSRYGHLIQPKEEVIESLKYLHNNGVFVNAYVQSKIYDPLYSEEDKIIAEKAVKKTLDEKIVYYQEPYWSMCNYTKWWQDRCIEIAKQSILQLGFSGVYLDSFGRGDAECFVKEHGHPVGGGNTVIYGQRELAKRMKEELTKYSKDFYMGGEAPIEAFVDVLDYYLLSLNVYPNYIPLARSVYGDYIITHGRSIAPVTEGNLVAELAILFLEGSIIGRIFCEGSQIFLKNPDYEQIGDFIKKISFLYNSTAIDYLRFGEYLRPTYFKETIPTVSFKECCENSKVVLPAILNSVCRSHKDDSIGIVFVNIGTENFSGNFFVSPEWLSKKTKGKGTLYKVDEKGQREKIAEIKSDTYVPLSLSPTEIAFFILN